jgi:hypothetical protein
MSLINTPTCSKNFDKLKDLSIKILQIYADLDKSDSYTNNKKQYYTNADIDLTTDNDQLIDNLTEFEKLSDKFDIGVVSRLNHIQASIVVHIFKMLFDNNFWIYEQNIGSFLFVDLELSESDLSKLYEEYDTNTWINTLERYLLDQYEDIEFIDEDTSIFGPIYISSKLPSKKDNHQYMSIDGIIKQFILN